MIVNPQFFNYRLIIGSLIVAVTLLTVFSFTSYQSIEAQQQFLEQEKNLVEGELSEMIERYDETFLTNNIIASQLLDAKSDAQLALDSLRTVKTDLSALSKLKQQLNYLKVTNKSLFSTIDSLDDVNSDLQSEKHLAYTELRREKNENLSLKRQNASLNRDIEKASLISANSFKAIGYSHDIGIRNASKKAKHVSSIEVCFALAENVLAASGRKNLYIQILDPKNNVVADKGVINFGKDHLIYSQKLIVDYKNDDIDVCLDVKAEANEKPLLPGTYFISVFEDGRRLGGTQLNLR
ncbi:hypothetical protein [Sediminibacter sp. Hel_I_10]|uniref:hypothetical protein n=1 Tax=Sediminibacter sp. Hel_I_10 TaxID=1392490 RepID=UPI000478C417|nr:hypothetical protein [Sediminibacter sp. Hel_I_10]